MNVVFPRALSLLTLGSALGCGIMAGTFFAFSTFVMPALAKLPSSQGIAAMQSINVVVLNRWFLGVFLGTALGCASLSVGSMIHGSGRSTWLVVAGSALYVFGAIGVTVWFNVPLNDALAAQSPDAPDAAAAWRTFVAEWTRWNSIRSAAALAGAALLILGLVERARAS
jgi:uncharacterized membrane protein